MKNRIIFFKLWINAISLRCAVSALPLIALVTHFAVCKTANNAIIEGIFVPKLCSNHRGLEGAFISTATAVNKDAGHQ